MYGRQYPIVFDAQKRLLGGVRVVNDSNAIRGRRLVAYVVDGVLIFLGILGLVIESSEAKPSSTNFFGYVLAVLFLACGAIVCLAIRSGYGGGAWSLCGLLLFAAAIARLTSIMQVHMQGRNLISPVVSYSTAAALWGAGCYCLAWGHMRRHREAPNKSLQATAAAPGS